MLYNPETGKRKKSSDGKAFISSVRSVLKLENFNLNQCLFGLHLINESTQQTIAVVESEKTAVIMSVFKPNYIWVATGMKGGFKYDILKPIKGYKIIAFPDKSEYNDWLHKAIELNGFGFKIVVNDWLEHTDYEDGTDFADVYINKISNSTPETIINEIKNNSNPEDDDYIRKQIRDTEERNNRIRIEIEDLENTFIQASKRCKVKWFAPNYIIEPQPHNRLQQLIYWTT